MVWISGIQSSWHGNWKLDASMAAVVPNTQQMTFTKLLSKLSNSVLGTCSPYESGVVSTILLHTSSVIC